MSLVVFTGLAGIVAAPGSLRPLTAFTALLCIAVAAGASGCLNMAYDSDIDRLMSRTATRPIPMGYVGRDEALAFGWTLAVASVAVMGLFVNFLAAGLLAFTIFFYVVVYTLGLKRRTPQNIVIGGLCGPLPPATGWARVAGGAGSAGGLMAGTRSKQRPRYRPRRRGSTGCRASGSAASSWARPALCARCLEPAGWSGPHSRWRCGGGRR